MLPFESFGRTRIPVVRLFEKRKKSFSCGEISVRICIHTLIHQHPPTDTPAPTRASHSLQLKLTKVGGTVKRYVSNPTVGLFCCDNQWINTNSGFLDLQNVFLLGFIVGSYHLIHWRHIAGMLQGRVHQKHILYITCMSTTCKTITGTAFETVTSLFPNCSSYFICLRVYET